ncbi:MAG: NAD-dependent epimerase/dehydratase, partial [Candidatus Wolfebacteria bacterium GW2011_GWA1_47_6]
NYVVFAPLRNELNLIDDDAVGVFLKKNNIDVIIHSATTSLSGKTYPLEVCEHNLRMFFNLQKHMTPAIKLINLGSGSEYGRSHWHKKMAEEYFDEHIPEDSHSYSKYLISKYVRDINSEQLVCLRLFGIFGKYEDYRYKFIANAIVKSLLGMPIVINQNVVYDYLYINDLYKIIGHFIHNDSKEKIFNVTPTESIDLVTIANIINELSGNTTEIQVLNPGIGVEYSGDNKKLLSEMGDFKFTSSKAAIAELYAYYRTIQDNLDVDAVGQDLYLNYAKELRSKYFKKEEA